MREPHEWPALQLGNDVRLLLGWRTGRRGIDARPVRLSDAVATELRGACTQTLARLGGGTRRTYTGVPALEPGEYLSLPLTDEEGQDQAEALTQAGALLAEDAVNASHLIQLTRDAFGNDNFLTRSELQEGRWLFYAVVVDLPAEQRAIAFVRQYNPQRGFRAGRLLLAYQETLSRFDDPLFNFDLEFDLVIAPDEIVILNTTAFDRVFADLDVAAARVPDQLSQLTTSLAVPLTDEATQFIQATCQAEPRWRDALDVSHRPHI